MPNLKHSIWRCIKHKIEINDILVFNRVTIQVNLSLFLFTAQEATHLLEQTHTLNGGKLVLR